VLPSYTESFGIVVAEALYSGIPVITSTETPWKNIEELSYGKVVNINVNSLTKALDSLSYSIIKKKITYQKRNEMRS
jgi:glycosyltransferase involved in cell wall biosynthesis